VPGIAIRKYRAVRGEREEGRKASEEKANEVAKV